MQISERMLEKFNSVDSLIIKNISDLNEKVDVQTEILSGFGTSQTLTNIGQGIIIIILIAIFVLILIKKQEKL